jgi:hypothetical protein
VVRERKTKKGSGVKRPVKGERRRRKRKKKRKRRKESEKERDAHIERGIDCTQNTIPTAHTTRTHTQKEREREREFVLVASKRSKPELA